MRVLAWFFFAASLALCTIGQWAVRIANPDKSETRLILDYWWYWGLSAAALLIAMALLRYQDRRSA